MRCGRGMAARHYGHNERGMARPDRFNWIEHNALAAMARPRDAEELGWLRRQGIQLIISLSENPLPRHWINDAGLLALHVSVADMEAPTQEQLDQCLSAINKARSRKFAVAVHCTAGLGRTGTVLAAYFVERGLDPGTAIARVRELRPGSVETPAQEQAVYEFARRMHKEESADDTH